VFKIGPGMHDALYRVSDEWASVNRGKKMKGLYIIQHIHIFIRLNTTGLPKGVDGCLIRPLWMSKAGPAKGSYPRLDTFLCMAV